ncbi:arrestin domain-containing protein [Diaporthe amygdali]|uniref:arrestin domain-containing protein n=1 Tax=Phomopsis amygdali TaxID=1214568 RepID=UPI0022FE730D|nr:arrestin domain-containing protein [Diaporthe amygdali]KAJ0119212.1 arrestin domain-containing protein [Diaporthe amygdali]
MSVRIALANPPEFYTNLDVISGKIILGISRPEQIGAVIVKLEGESKTALGAPDATDIQFGGASRRRATVAENSQTLHENHKILYRVQQVFPGENVPAYATPVVLNPGQHEWPFSFKVPFNNACGDPNAMVKIGGLAGAGGFAGPSLFGMGGIRLMDGSKQLLYPHVTKTLPPSFTGFPREAEIRYYVKVTIQRPGLFKENIRHQLGFKFMPIEPPRPPSTNQEGYARRPFTFTPKSPGSNGNLQAQSKRQSVFSRKQSSTSLAANGSSSSDHDQPPSIEVSARLPHPAILTCNKPIPLRLLAKKLVATSAECYLVSLQVDLVGSTLVRCQDLVNTETTRWVVVTRHDLAIPLQRGPNDAVGTETEINNVLWSNRPLPNTVMPSFVTCNLKRSYALELKLGVSWGKPPGTATAIPDEGASQSSLPSKMKMGKSKGKGKDPMYNMAQTMFLPLHFSSVQVYSGLEPPASLAQAAMKARRQQTQQRPTARPSQSAPALPPRQERPHDPLYPPQLRPGQTASQAQSHNQAPTAAASAAASAAAGGAVAEAPPAYDDAPPSYDDAMADAMVEPVVPDGRARPAWSGVTNENSPDSLPGKS